MDAQAKKKALYRAKLNAQKLEKRIDSPLIRYNESDQPVCRVCDVVLKSESLWPAHQASRKHREAIDNVKAKAAGLTRVDNVKAEPAVELPKPKPKPKPECSIELHNAKPDPSAGSAKPRSLSMLPPGFFDNQETKRQKKGGAYVSMGGKKNPGPDEKGATWRWKPTKLGSEQAHSMRILAQDLMGYSLESQGLIISNRSVNCGLLDLFIGALGAWRRPTWVSVIQTMTSPVVMPIGPSLG